MFRRALAGMLLVLLGTLPAAAGAPTDRMRTLFDATNRVILAPESDGGLEERVTAVRALVNGVFDFDGAAALALGRHWETLSAPERAAFSHLYADVIERAYLAWIGSKARLGEDGVSVRWTGERIDGDTATVTSTLLTRVGTEFPIEYRMVRRANDWLVRDVVVDGLSLAANYHVQFSRVLQMGSYEELLARLHERAGPVARAQAGAITAGAIRAMVAAPAPPGPPAVASRPATAPATARTVAEARTRVAEATATDAAPSVLAVPAVAHEGELEAEAVEPPTVAAPAPAAVAAASPALAPAAPAVVAAEPARTVAAAAPPATRSRAFWVQVGAFRNPDAATRLVQRLQRHAVTLAMHGAGPQPLTRVLVGPFAERTEATSAVRELQANGIAAFIANGPE